LSQSAEEILDRVSGAFHVETHRPVRKVSYPSLDAEFLGYFEDEISEPNPLNPT
jgi:hypothetical protein